MSRNTMLAMIYKLGMSAEKRWRRIRGFNYLAKVIKGVWIQRITLPIDRHIPYEEPICKLVSGGTVPLWNMEWITDNELNELTESIKTPVINEKLIEGLKPVIPINEVELFPWDYY